jgi:DNA repair protein SbcC/Rad50
LRIHKIVLENIRSYSFQEIDFPLGSLLLWGNIGSGKSTILLAIDFALFGLQRGTLTGASLLRNGAAKGFVELHFYVQEELYIIRRALKRSKDSVVQDTGHFIYNGIKEDKTAVELKQRILEVLNYPKDLLTKNKSLIYRYTVYTPQEEMKNILLGSQEERLDTLRKVFGVDKYKRVTQNTKVLISRLKNLKKLYEGVTQDLNEKIIDRNFKITQKEELQRSLRDILPRLNEAISVLKNKQEELTVLDTKREEFVRINKSIALLQVELKHKIEQKGNEAARIVSLEIELKELEGLVLPKGVEQLLEEKQRVLQEQEKQVREYLRQIQEVITKKSFSVKIKEKMESLNNCPTCLQEVTHVHKDKVVSGCNLEIQNFDSLKNSLGIKQQEAQAFVEGVHKEIEVLRGQQREAHVLQLKIVQREKKREEVQRLIEQSSHVKQRVGAINVELSILDSSKEQLRSVEQEYTFLKTQVEKARESFNLINVEKHRVEATIAPVVSTLKKLEEEIEKKSQTLGKKERVGKTLYWLSSYFIPLMELMERNILLTVHSEFNSLFEKWFSILMDNQSLRMSLDENYSPRIWQSGYDIEYSFLSGGEKTAGALAYRLALNQVINNLNTGLRTKDLLILDEPTDGFSHDQLDRLRILMDEIDIPQIILVSHEPQIESFVDNIIKLEKVNHETRVL